MQTLYISCHTKFRWSRAAWSWNGLKTTRLNVLLACFRQSLSQWSQADSRWLRMCTILLDDSGSLKLRQQPACSVDIIIRVVGVFKDVYLNLSHLPVQLFRSMWQSTCDARHITLHRICCKEISNTALIESLAAVCQLHSSLWPNSWDCSCAAETFPDGGNSTIPIQTQPDWGSHWALD